MPASKEVIKIKMQETYNVGIYCRLSRDDERTGESVSIENRREMLSRYVREQGWNLYDTYCDGCDIIGLRQQSLDTQWFASI